MFFKALRERFARARQRQVMVNLLDMFAANRPLGELWDVRKFADEGYRRNSLVFACITLKSIAFMDPELVAFTSRGAEVAPLPDGHMLNKLLARPNAKDTQSALFRKWSIHLDVAGNAYLLKLRNRLGMPIGLRFLRPDCTRPIPDSSGEVVAFEYGLQTNHGGYSQVDLETGVESLDGRKPQVFPAADVIHEMSHPDPVDPYRGLSPIAVLARMGDLDNYAADYLRSFFLNAGIPSGLLKFKVETTKTERDKVRDQWKERYSLRPYEKSGVGGAFNLFVTDSDVEYEEIGSKLKTMDLSGVFGETESRICSTLGVPPILVAAHIGLVHGTYSNYEQAVKHFYKMTLRPSWTSTADRFTVDLAAPEFGDSIVCQFDLSEIQEMREDETAAKKFALSAWNSGLITRNEARADCGFPADAEGDVYKVLPTETFEPASIEQTAARPRLEKFGRAELHAKLRTAEWKQLREIARRATPALKKKSSRELRVVRGLSS